MRFNVLSASIAASLLLSATAYASAPGPAHARNGAQQTTDNATSQNPSQQSETQQTGAKTKAHSEEQSAVKLKGVTVAAGIRASQKRSIQIKRNAPNISDSITAVNIGQLPDVSITDSLQRLTGVQINRSAGEGTSVSVRGLPEVSTTLNGMPFISADNIDSIQPNYGTLPASMFSGVDVYKSPTASMLNSGISGTINLRTYQPFDFDLGWSATASAEAARGSVTKETKPNINATINFNDGGKWGVLLSASYSDLVRNNGSNSFYNGGRIAGENASDARNANNKGFISAWGSIPVPPSIVQLPDGSVAVGGIKNGAFLVPGDGAMTANHTTVQRKRKGLHLAFAAGFGGGFLLNVNGFYVHQVEGNYNVNAVPDGLNHNVATFIPLKAHGTGVRFTNPAAVPGKQAGDWNQQFYTVQKFKYYLGSFRSASTATRTVSNARNFTASLSFDNGGPFTANLDLASNSATRGNTYADIQFVQADGTSWGNHLKPGVSLPPGVFPGPPSQGGNHFFNPGGMAAASEIATINTLSDNPISISQALAARILDPGTYVSKGFDSSGYNQSADNRYVRLDAAFRFNPDLSIKGGVSNSVRTAHNDSWVGLTPVYAGEGASDPNGCLVRWVYDDQILDGGGVPGACTASSASGYFHANPLGNLRPTEYPGVVSNHLRTYELGGVKIMGLDPHAMAHPAEFINTLAPGLQRGPNPTANWDVSLHTVKAFAQADFSGTLGGVPFSGNFGMRYVHMQLGVTQFLAGPPAAYGAMSPASGSVRTHNTHDYWLPALNVAIHPTSELIWRFAMSKNMMPLTLSQWGGGISESFRAVAITLPNGQHVLPVSGANSNGNPNLKPWYSTNYGTSLEYYFNKGSMLSVALFDMNIASFVQQSGTLRCDLPDADGVVRHRCVPVTTLIQGSGAQLKGIELDYKQALTFLPGLLSHTGFEINATLSPSTTGKKDLAGNDVPFPGNSKKSGNFIIWYQDSHWQARVALNYRSKELISTNQLGVQGFDVYEKPQTYLAASVTYTVGPHLQFYAQGQNLTNEKQEYYLTWPSQAFRTNFSERYVMLGARVHF